MRDDDVDRARRARSVEHARSTSVPLRKRDSDLDAHRPVGEAVAEVLVVLLGEQRGGHQHRHLLAGLHGDERGAHAPPRSCRSRRRRRPRGPSAARCAGPASTCAIASAWSAVSSNGKACREGLVVALVARRARGPARACALRVQVEQFGGHVADLLAAARRAPCAHWSVPSLCSGAASAAAPV